jgi:hypothetical protein
VHPDRRGAKGPKSFQQKKEGNLGIYGYKKKVILVSKKEQTHT